MHFDIVSAVIGLAIALIVSIPVTANVVTARRKKQYDEKVGSAEERARQIIDDAVKTAEAKKRESMLEIKEESIRTKNELEKETKERRAEVQRLERRMVQREEDFSS